MIKAERLAVAVCTHNGSRFISEQLESIALQTRLPDELVICDDASTDTTAEIVRNFKHNAPFPVHLRVNERNVGWKKNFEKAITLCNADSVFPSDQDDVWLPQKLEKMESVLMDRPTLGLVFCDAEHVDEKLQPLGARYWDSVGFSNRERRCMSSGKGIDVLIRHNVVAGCMMGFRSRFREEVLPVPPNWGHDGWIAFIIAAVAGVAPLEEVLVKYRRHETQQVGVRQQSLAQRLTATAEPVNSFSDIVESDAVAIQKLLSLPNVRWRNELISHIEAKDRHLNRRAHLPGSIPARLPAVLAELASGRYHRYSNGLQSLVKDVVA